MNGAQAQTYFAVQTRRQEVQDQNPQPRIELRQRVKEANRNLNSAAKGVGVQNYIAGGQKQSRALPPARRADERSHGGGLNGP